MRFHAVNDPEMDK